MHRKPLLDMLARYEARWPAERAVVRRIRELVEAHADCFERTCRPGHVTGSAWVLSADRSRCLLVHHRKLDRWIQPGGHADGDPDVLAVALREAAEETGLTDLEVLSPQQPLLKAVGGLSEPDWLGNTRPESSSTGPASEGEVVSGSESPPTRMLPPRVLPVPLDIDVHVIPARRLSIDEDGAAGELIEDAHEHHDIRFLLAPRRESPLVVSDESHDVRWFTPTEIEQLTSEESVLRLLRKSLCDNR